MLKPQKHNTIPAAPHSRRGGGAKALVVGPLVKELFLAASLSCKDCLLCLDYLRYVSVRGGGGGEEVKALVVGPL